MSNKIQLVVCCPQCNEPNKVIFDYIDPKLETIALQCLNCDKNWDYQIRKLLDPKEVQKPKTYKQVIELASVICHEIAKRAEDEKFPMSVAIAATFIAAMNIIDAINHELKGQMNPQLHLVKQVLMWEVQSLAYTIDQKGKREQAERN